MIKHLARQVNQWLVKRPPNEHLALFSSTAKPLRGGVALPRKKPGLSASKDIRALHLPGTICIPLLNYQQEAVPANVSVGESVKPGDALAPGIVASCFGTIKSIETCAINHPSGEKALCVIITPATHTANQTALYSAQKRLTAQRISACAIHGLGGAGFNTTNKLNAINASGNERIGMLIINAVECEPLISCDESLVANQAPAVVKAIEGLINLTRCHHCVLAIEDDKTTAIEALKCAIADYPHGIRFDVAYLAPVYPAGAERLLVERLTGKKLPTNTYPASQGIVCINVATALATEYARQGYPLISRVVTVAGELCANPINVRVLFGTAVYDVIKQTDNLKYIDTACVRIGGPLSGFLIKDLSAPVTATTNCITLEQPARVEQIHACIKCGACSDVCPVNLLPQQLHTYCINENTEKANKLRLSECIECACCDVVCPSNIPLTQSFRFAKGLIREQSRQSLLAIEAESRYKKRESRLAKDAEKRALEREAARSQLASSADAIADALARAKQRRKRSAGGQ